MSDIKDFKIKEDQRDNWEEGLKNNTDPYGREVYNYASRWANLMEERMASGLSLKTIAKDTSMEVANGITGFMYGCAVSILSNCWEHGEELRRWHNIDTQIMNEGEKANESGGVLNPAIINLGGLDNGNKEKE